MHDGPPFVRQSRPLPHFPVSRSGSSTPTAPLASIAFRGHASRNDWKIPLGPPSNLSGTVNALFSMPAPPTLRRAFRPARSRPGACYASSPVTRAGRRIGSRHTSRPEMASGPMQTGCRSRLLAADPKQVHRPKSPTAARVRRPRSPRPANSRIQLRSSHSLCNQEAAGEMRFLRSPSKSRANVGTVAISVIARRTPELARLRSRYRKAWKRAPPVRVIRKRLCGHKNEIAPGRRLSHFLCNPMWRAIPVLSRHRAPRVFFTREARRRPGILLAR
jgi:hypothetical protein